MYICQVPCRDDVERNILALNLTVANSNAAIENSLNDFSNTEEKSTTPAQYSTLSDPYGKKEYFNIAPKHYLLKTFTDGGAMITLSVVERKRKVISI